MNAATPLCRHRPRRQIRTVRRELKILAAADDLS
jgi:hypothetical protein